MSSNSGDYDPFAVTNQVRHPQVAFAQRTPYSVPFFDDFGYEYDHNDSNQDLSSIDVEIGPNSTPPVIDPIDTLKHEHTNSCKKPRLLHPQEDSVLTMSLG